MAGIWIGALRFVGRFHCACLVTGCHVTTFVQLFSSLGFAAVVGFPLSGGTLCVGRICVVDCVLVVISLTNVWWIYTPQNSTQLAVYGVVSLRTLACVISRRLLNKHEWIQEGRQCSEQSVWCLVLLKFKKVLHLLYFLSKPTFVLSARLCCCWWPTETSVKEMVRTAKKEVEVWHSHRLHELGVKDSVCHIKITLTKIFRPRCVFYQWRDDSRAIG
jgi:hypothetical protein